jgi:transcriptional regulator with XRE-family HTH domain
MFAEGIVDAADGLGLGAEMDGTGAESTALMVFAAELRAQRQARGWTQVALGDKIGYSGSFVSDVERCERTPALEFATACDRDLGLPGTFARLHELVRRDAYPSWFQPVITFESRAVRIHEWEMRGVPGLLQTEEYARAVIRAGRPKDSDESVAQAVSARLERQEILSGGRSPMLWFVLHEGVLRHLVGGPGVMAGQLDRLIELAGKPGIVVQVLPFAAWEHAGVNGPIMVFEFADGPTACYTECYGGGRVVEAPDDVVDLVVAVNMIRASALSPGESVELVRKIRSEIYDR